MKDKRTLFSILYSLAVIAGLAAVMIGVHSVQARAEDTAPATSGNCGLFSGDNLKWSYNESTNTLTISGTGMMKPYSSSTLNGTTVTTAPWRPFYNTMHTIEIESGVSTIGNSAFYGCEGLTMITIPDSVTGIGSYAFYNCTGLTGVTIPDSVTSIGSSAFSGCTGLTNVTIPDGVTSIGSSAFQKCTGLTEITLPFLGATATSTETSGVFGYIFGNTTSSSSSAPTGSVYQYELISDGACNYYHYYIPTSLRKVTITSATKIPENAFQNCTFLTEIHLPQTVTTIGNYAFKGCTGLTSITIPDSVTSVGDSAFNGCTGLQKVIIQDLAKWCEISFSSSVSNPLYYAKHLYLDGMEVTALVVPESVTSIGGYAFCGCTGLTSVTIPDSVTGIGESAFSGCSGLQKVNIHDLAKWCEISFSSSVSNPLYYAKHLYLSGTEVTTLVIPDGVTSIKPYAFHGCTGLTSVTISDGVTSIGGSAFYGCAGLTSVTIPNSVTSIGGSAFYGCAGLTSITIPSSVTSIGGSAFYGCAGLTGVTIPDGVTSIGSSAFSGCTGLTSITIPSSVTSIGGSAFYGCAGLTSVTIPNSVTSIGGFTFENCTGLTSVTIGNGVASIGAYAFYGCHALETVTLPEALSNIGACAFYDCGLITDLTIPKNVQTIDTNAFYHLNGLKSFTFNAQRCSGSQSWNTMTGSNDIDVIIGDDVEIIPYALTTSFSIKSLTIGKNVQQFSRAFVGRSNLKSIIYNAIDCPNARFEACGLNTDGVVVTIGNDVKTIPDYFLQRMNIASINIPRSVTSIGQNAFSVPTNTIEKLLVDSPLYENLRIQCTDEIIFGDAIVNISNLFANNAQLKKITIGKNVTTIQAGAFENCTGLTSVTIPVSVTSIGDSAFAGCTGLTEIIYKAKDCTSYSPSAFRNAGTASDGILVEITDDVERIPDFMFDLYSTDATQLPQITTVSIGKNVRKIGQRAFFNLPKLEKIFFNAAHCAVALGSMGVSPFGHGVALNSSTVGFSVEFGEDVTVIPANVFHSDILFGPVKLLSIRIGSHVKTIEEKAFDSYLSQMKVKEVDIPSSVTEIGDGAFYGCSSIESIRVFNPNISVGYNAFYRVQDIEYDGNAPEAPWGAKALNAYKEDEFYYYDETKTLLLACDPDATGALTVPDTVQEVGPAAFTGCEGITELTFESDEIIFTPTCFAGCTNLAAVSSPNTDGDGITYATGIPGSAAPMQLLRASSGETEEETDSVDVRDNGIVKCNRNAAMEYTVPDEIRFIGEDAFYKCTTVTVIIPDSVHLISIGANAFTDCGNYNSDSFWTNDVFTIGKYIIEAKSTLTTFSLGSAIRGIADAAFSKCLSMSSFVFDAASLDFIGARAFENSGLSTVSGTLPNNLRRIGANAFQGTSFDNEENAAVNGGFYLGNCLYRVDPAATTLTVKPGTTCIGESALANHYNLRSVTLPDGLTFIGDDAFAGCVNLQSISLPTSLTNIGENAFRDCISLPSVSIPANVSEIGDFAFCGCAALESFIVANGNQNYLAKGGVLFKADGTTLIQYPAARDADVYNATENNVKTIADLAFRRCNNLTNVTLPEAIEFGLRNPFEGCKASFNGASYILSKGGANLVSVSTSFTGRFEIPEKVKSIGIGAFRDCTGITGIDWNQRVGTIDKEAFMGCTGLTTLEFPKSLKKILASAFEDCTNLQVNAAMFRNVQLIEIGARAFCNCIITDGFDGTRLGFQKEELERKHVFHTDDYDGVEWRIEKEATCLSYGVRVRTCKDSGCGHEQRELIPYNPNVHTPGEWRPVKRINGMETQEQRCADCGELLGTREVSCGPKVVSLQSLQIEPREFVTAIFTFFFKLFFEVFRIAFRR